jgi:hypothetical protein
VHADAVLDPFAEPAPDQRRIAPGTRAWRRLGRRKASPKASPTPTASPASTLRRRRNVSTNDGFFIFISHKGESPEDRPVDAIQM